MKDVANKGRINYKKNRENTLFFAKMFRLVCRFFIQSQARRAEVKTHFFLLKQRLHGENFVYDTEAVFVRTEAICRDERIDEVLFGV